MIAVPLLVVGILPILLCALRRILPLLLRALGGVLARLLVAAHAFLALSLIRCARSSLRLRRALRLRRLTLTGLPRSRLA
jgi:hypothetical protein